MTSPLSPEAVAQMVADLTHTDGPNGEMSMLYRGVIADALATLAAENAMLRAEQAMLKFDIDKMLTQIEGHNAAWDELRASEAAAVARADHARDAALVEAAKVCEAQKVIFLSPEYAVGQPISSYSERFACGCCATAILALRDKPVHAVTVQEAILEVWGCCEELEDEALAKLSGVKTEHEKGFWTGQKMTAKRIRRATQMPIAGGGNE